MLCKGKEICVNGGCLYFRAVIHRLKEVEEEELRNSKNKKLLCLLLTAAMLVQPLAVSASAEEPVAEQADLQDDEMSADLMEMPPADQTEPVDTESEEPVTDLAGQTDAEAADLDDSESDVD